MALFAGIVRFLIRSLLRHVPFNFLDNMRAAIHTSTVFRERNLIWRPRCARLESAAGDTG